MAASARRAAEGCASVRGDDPPGSHRSWGKTVPPDLAGPPGLAEKERVQCFVGVVQQTRVGSGPVTAIRSCPATSSITASRSTTRRRGSPLRPWRAEGGPWDAGEAFPAQERVDLGSLQVPVGPEHEIQLVMAEQHGAWVTVRYRESEVQIQAFAAARRSTLWDDVRAEIAAEVHTAGGRSQESEGSFGTELMAQVPTEPGQPASGMRLVRFVGIDGPRWFVRGLFTGPCRGRRRAGRTARGGAQERRSGPG